MSSGVFRSSAREIRDRNKRGKKLVSISPKPEQAGRPRSAVLAAEDRSREMEHPADHHSAFAGNVDLLWKLPGGGRAPRLSAFASAPRDRYSAAMTLEEIKASISQLTLEERAEVARCLHAWEDDDWDQQMRRDLAAKKLDATLKKVDADIEQSRLRDAP